MDFEFELKQFSDIERLVTDQVRESNRIEFKQELDIGPTENRRKFLASVSSFANAGGGVILFGIAEGRDAENKGMAIAAPGLKDLNIDQVSLQIEQLIRDGIDPRIEGLTVSRIDGGTLGPILMIRIPQSWSSPHMVKFGGVCQFYSRGGAGKYQLDVRQIRSAFARSEKIADRVRSFRTERYGHILSGETPVPLSEQPCPTTIVHVIPVHTIDSSSAFDVRGAKKDGIILWPPGLGGGSHRLNLDGILTIAGSTRESGNDGYVQFFRNGAIEAVTTQLTSDNPPYGKFIPLKHFESMTHDAVQAYRDALIRVGLPFPYAVSITILNCRGLFALANSTHSERHPIHTQNMFLPEVLIESESDVTATVLRPIFDVLWQSNNFKGSSSYDDLGHWTRPAG